MDLDNFMKFNKLFHKMEISIIDQKLNEIFRKYSFIHISKIIAFEQYPIIYQNIKESNVVIINQSIKNNQKQDGEYFIISFKSTIIFIEQNSIEYLQPLFSLNPAIKFCFLSNTKEIFNKYITYNYIENNINQYFKEEINNFNQYFQLTPILDKPLYFIWKTIQTSITGYLIQQSYSNLKNSRIQANLEAKSFNDKEFIEMLTIETDSSSTIQTDLEANTLTTFDEKEFIEIRTIGTGSSFSAKLAYHIEKEELFVIMQSYKKNEEIDKLIEREINNYSNINYPLIPKFYGTIKDKNYPIIEFINGIALNEIDLNELSNKDKCTILFEIICIIAYLHMNKFVYRDLKPDNIIIDSNKTAFLVDFDRMIRKSNTDKNTNSTMNFSTEFMAPEVDSGIITDKCDIYSIGKMINYIFQEKSQKINSLKTIYTKCINVDIDKRPPILVIMFDFYTKFKNKIDTLILQNDQNFQFINDIFYEDERQKIFIYIIISHYSNCLINNDKRSAYLLGNIYYEGKFVNKNIDKSFYYFKIAKNTNYLKAPIETESKISIKESILYCSFALKYNLLGPNHDLNSILYFFSHTADRGLPEAQYNLGVFYLEGKYFELSINKAIHYLTLAANQNHIDAQYLLGKIYHEGNVVIRDIDKAIYYYTCAANQNMPEAQFIVALIYYEDIFVPQNINKAIYYLSLAASNNHSKAQFCLGNIYYNGQYVQKDVNKAIYYYSLAANQNEPHAQVNLGNIYHEGKYVAQNITKTIYYYTLAAKQNIKEAQVNLGYIYHKGKEVMRDIDKAIYYYKLASDKNDPTAQYQLGTIYYIDENVPKNMNKAIYYFTHAANQNHEEALFYLGDIYFKGEDVKKNINKAIYYYSLAANKKNPIAHFILGYIYQNGINVEKDINKAIYYYSLSADLNYSYAQYIIGSMYLNGFVIEKNIEKGLYYLEKSSNANYDEASFIIGYLYHKGEYVNGDIHKSIIEYKKASSYNNKYAKNNLGVIYKYGFQDEIRQNIGISISYFEDSIRQKNDEASMYNLSNIYIYHDKNTQRIIKSIELLVRSSNLGLSISKELLCIALIKKFGNNLNDIKIELNKHQKQSINFTNEIIELIKTMNLFNKKIFEIKFKFYEKIYLLYDDLKEIVVSDNSMNETMNIQKNKIRKNLTIDFYEGFGIQL